MNTVFLDRAQIESCVRTSVEFDGICCSADLYLVLERIRKDEEARKLRLDLCSGNTQFQRQCQTGKIMFLPLDHSLLVDAPFIDTRSELLELDPAVFQSNAPEDSVRQLNAKDLRSWGW